MFIISLGPHFIPAPDNLRQAYFFIKSFFKFAIRIKKFSFQHREDWKKLETEYRSVAELREERKFRLNSIFDVEYAP